MSFLPLALFTGFCGLWALTGPAFTEKAVHRVLTAWAGPVRFIRRFLVEVFLDHARGRVRFPWIEHVYTRKQIGDRHGGDVGSGPILQQGLNAGII